MVSGDVYLRYPFHETHFESARRDILLVVNQFDVGEL